MGIRKRKTWRCFHCDEVFYSRKAAWAHFGDDSYCAKEVPACVDPLREDEKKRITDLREAQRYALDMENEAMDMENEARELSDRVDNLEMELSEFKAHTKSSSIHELRMKLDSDKGRLATAEMLIQAIREKAPHVYREIIC